eukprot:364100-Chlamydomonas_euryale.AAC.7
MVTRSGRVVRVECIRQQAVNSGSKTSGLCFGGAEPRKIVYLPRSVVAWMKDAWDELEACVSPIVEPETLRPRERLRDA